MMARGRDAVDARVAELLPRRGEERVEAELVRLAEPTLKWMARQFVTKHGLPSDAVEDLIAEGRLGALKAVRTFDEKRGRFRSWVRQQALPFMQEWVTSHARATKIPIDVLRNPRRTNAQLKRLDDGTHDGANLGARLRMKGDESLNAPVGGEDAREAVELLADEGPTPAEAVERDQVRQKVAQAVDQLPDHERQVVVARVVEEKTLKEAGAQRLDGSGALSHTRVSQIEERGKSKLAKALEWAAPPPPQQVNTGARPSAIEAAFRVLRELADGTKMVRSLARSLGYTQQSIYNWLEAARRAGWPIKQVQSPARGRAGASYCLEPWFAERMFKPPVENKDVPTVAPGGDMVASPRRR